MPVYLDSEIGKLKSVIVHTPGREVEAMTPSGVDRVLYNEIVPVAAVQREHALFKSVLQQAATVYEFTDLLAGALEDSHARSVLIRAVSQYSHAPEREEELMELETPRLVDTLIGGLRKKQESLTAVLSERIYDIPPLPNLYFTRDGAAVFLDRVLFGRMAHDVRALESLLLKTLFHYAPELHHAGVLFDGLQEWSEGISVEGGDILVWDRRTLIVGVSERTSAQAIDRIAENLVSALQQELDILAVVLPRRRATIHLDTVFTLIDKELALVDEPTLLGNNPAPVYLLRCRPGEPTNVTAVSGILDGVAALGRRLETVACGGDDPVRREREQWLSAANAFAIAPGQIVVYDCNEATLAALEGSGFRICSADAISDGTEELVPGKRVAVAVPGVELARGGGGPRCMTLPVEREPMALDASA